MRNYALPNRDECLALIAECHVPAHIVRHSEATARLGVFLAERLNENGATVDVALVERACLLHDLFRVCDFPLEDFSWFEQPVSEEDKEKWRRLKARHGGNQHEDAAAIFLDDRYPVLAETIRKHRYTALLNERDRPWTWEEKLLYYADKRVMHDTIVTLRERLEEAHKRSAFLLARAGQRHDVDTEQKVDAQIFALEKDIFAPLKLDPEAVTANLIATYNGSPDR